MAGDDQRTRSLLVSFSLTAGNLLKHQLSQRFLHIKEKERCAVMWQLSFSNIFLTIQELRGYLESL